MENMSFNLHVVDDLREFGLLQVNRGTAGNGSDAAKTETEGGDFFHKRELVKVDLAI
jgi:hypothetical protein